MYGYIYKTTNLVNGKEYIGKHRAKKFEPKRYIGSGPILLRALKKYGRDKFKCELIEECISKQELNDREKYWIKYFNCIESSSFYNLAPGGEGGIGRGIGSYWENPQKQNNARFKTSVSLKEYYLKYHDAHSGKNNPNYGNKLSEESKNKISTKLKNSMGVKLASRFTGHRHTEESKQKISTDLKNRVWITNNDVEKRILSNEDIPVGWHYGRKISKETMMRLNSIITDKSHLDVSKGKAKKILCIELNKVYESAAEASRELNISKSQISLCCHKKRNTAGGYGWEFLGEKILNE